MVSHFHQIKCSGHTNEVLYMHFQTNFCYLCGAKLNKETPYAHFSDPSQECYNLLFEGVDPVQYYFALKIFLRLI